MNAICKFNLSTLCKVAACCVAIFSYSYATADTTCERHLYNITSTTQKFAVIGSIRYGGLAIYDQNNNLVCADSGCRGTDKINNDITTVISGGISIPANTTYTIEYRYGDTGSVGFFIALSGASGESTGDSGNFGDGNSIILQCPYISHDGDTGLPSVNEPANGDVTWGG